ncbi:4-hydroxythreonine-4-phosphate dehydrogenase PdxA [Lentisphaerota bacterium WC36G]|nr:4-hydroxythreonine-4-phosphate dehydrogenase PdxA [Lentisphaerae bacterium WC36]
MKNVVFKEILNSRDIELIRQEKPEIPILALTIGDAAGIGAELAVKAVIDQELAEMCQIVIYGSRDVICEAVNRFIPDYKIHHKIYFKHCIDLDFSEYFIGQVNRECGLAAYETVRNATQDCLDNLIDGIVTAPMNKASVNEADIEFTGHTELIAEMCGVENYAMMQSDGALRVVFVTTHIALNKVSETITKERIIEVTNLINDVIKQEGILEPKIAMAAINPHAGENGFMGDDEIKIVEPAIEELLKNNVKVTGPFPPDTLFIKAIRSKYDGIVSMYHDQGHIPFKMLAFDSGVNSTLGLPIIRTSCDHGTAFEIAWQGIADTGSLFAAVKLAAIRAKSKLN